MLCIKFISIPLPWDCCCVALSLRCVVQNSAVNWRSVHNVWCVPDGLMRFLDCCVAEITRLACCCVVLAAIGAVV